MFPLIGMAFAERGDKVLGDFAALAGAILVGSDHTKKEKSQFLG